MRKPKLELTPVGFKWGACEISRAFSGEKKGWVVIEAQTPKQRIQIYVTKTGKVTIFSVCGKWKEPK